MNIILLLLSIFIIGTTFLYLTRDKKKSVKFDEESDERIMWESPESPHVTHKIKTVKEKKSVKKTQEKPKSKKPGDTAKKAGRPKKDKGNDLLLS